MTQIASSHIFILRICPKWLLQLTVRAKDQWGEMTSMAQAPDVGRRTRVTRPYPSYTLQDSLSVARSIYDANAGLPFDRELLAEALGTTPKSSAFTIRLNASASYGLTEGGYNDPNIRLTKLGEAVVASNGDAEGRRAIIDAATFPETFARFYEMLDGRRLPESANLRSILQRDLGVHPNLTEECMRILLDNGEFAGIVEEADGQRLVRLAGPLTSIEHPNSTMIPETSAEVQTSPKSRQRIEIHEPAAFEPETNKAIFIGHIGESEAAKYVASVLEEFGIANSSPQIPEEDTGLLVPEEVSVAMRESSAAVLVFRSGDNAWSSRDKMIGMLGAASVLFEDRVVLLHEDGASLSINLDGLNHLNFDHERPGESGLNLLLALHSAGVISVTA